jgi:hypothetical protein
VESPPVQSGRGTILSPAVKPFAHTAKDPDLKSLDPLVRTGQRLGIWFVVIERAVVQWLALIIHLTLPSLVCASGGSYQHGFTFINPYQNGGRKL